MKTSPDEDPYAAPRASDEHVSQETIRPDAVRTAGILLLIDSALKVVTWLAFMSWDRFPRGAALVEAILEAAIGVGLLRFGRKLILPALALVLVSAARPVVRVAPMFAEGGIAILVGPVLFGVLRLMPVFLLLVGTPGRARHRVALIVFVAAQVLGLSVWILKIYATGRVGGS